MEDLVFELQYWTSVLKQERNENLQAEWLSNVIAVEEKLLNMGLCYDEIEALR